ncbi:membrane-spanning 4-domains subfamily A member 4D-like [Xyrichtys novacula]|uniref:Membrane-spanning 4-domains subfamily A member 4D-like n=1 Tax=Xyrichtys novacula TaxID=13765 RepID=A0AAV1FBJ8_XYRNO|nr:membrane-spanning 4-domains subfamily A member 4D-like [Xyrichtys novacula]
MEGTESTTRERTTKDENQDVLFSSKPLHRFVQREPRALGIAIVIFGCAEFLMGFPLVNEIEKSSLRIYIPFWQGALFLVSGNLSIYTERHPTKKMVTVCLAMYVVSLLGIIVSTGFRIVSLSYLGYRTMYPYYLSDQWELDRMKQVYGMEAVLCTCSLCVSVLLIFLCVIAGLALKSTRTQIIIQHTSAPQSDTPSN